MYAGKTVIWILEANQIHMNTDGHYKIKVAEAIILINFVIKQDLPRINAVNMVNSMSSTNTSHKDI